MQWSGCWGTNWIARCVVGLSEHSTCGRIALCWKREGCGGGDETAKTTSNEIARLVIVLSKHCSQSLRMGIHMAIAFSPLCGSGSPIGAPKFGCVHPQSINSRRAQNVASRWRPVI